MKYYTKAYTTAVITEATEEKAREILSGCYARDFVENIFRNHKTFKLPTPFREVWTSEDGTAVPTMSAYGVLN